MKKTIILSSLLLVACTVITSCKKSSSSNNSIVGSWELSSAHTVSVDSTTSPITVTTLDTTIAHGHSQIISFLADNTVILYDFTSTPTTMQNAGNYFVVGDSVTIFNSGSSTGNAVHFTIGGNVLTLFVNNHYSGSSYSAAEKFNRVQ